MKKLLDLLKIAVPEYGAIVAAVELVGVLVESGLLNPKYIKI